MKKEFGNSSRNQSNNFYAYYDQAMKEIDSFFNLASVNDEYKEAFSKAPPWANFYELPFSTTIGLIIISFGLVKEFQRIASSEDSLKELNSFMANISDEFTPQESLSNEEALLLLSAIRALLYQILAINMHGKSLSALVAIANEGDDKALFDAVMVDHSAIYTPSIAKRIHVAQSTNDTDFNKNLTKAMSDVKPKRRRPNKTDDDLRYMLALIEEQFGFGSNSKTVTYEKLYDLLSDDLHLYPKGKKEGSVDGLQKYIQRFSKKYRT